MHRKLSFFTVFVHPHSSISYFLVFSDTCRSFNTSLLGQASQCFLKTTLATLSAVVALVATQSADLQGTVGPLTSISDKKAVKTCDITDYGAKADGSTDISSALNDAFSECSSGGVIVIPSGDYALGNWVTMSGGTAWALQLDGVITRTWN